MLVECLNRRQGGTLIDFPVLGGAAVEYQFLPRAGDGRHVCEIEDEAHLKVLLGLPHTYREAPGAGKRKVPTRQAKEQEQGARLEPPEGFPKSLDEMSREQLLIYAAQVQVPGKPEELTDEMLRANIQATIDLLLANA